MIIPIATTLLTDISILGLGRREANRQVFELAEPVRGAILIADRVRRAGLGAELPNGCEDDIPTLCRSVQYDVGFLVGKMVAITAEQWSDTISWFPWDAISGRSVYTSNDFDLPELADAHLHSGAAIDMAGLCRLLTAASRTTPSEPNDLWSLDARGVGFDLKVVAHAVRHFLQFIGDADPRSRYGRRFASTIDAGTYWDLVRRAAMRPASHPEFLSDLWINDGPGDPAQVSARIHVMMSTLDDSLVALVTALSLISHELRSKDAEGLPRFVDRFEQMGLLRDTMLNDARAEVVAEACEHVFGSSAVVAAEFRKTIAVGRQVGGAATKISQSLSDHLNGFIRFAKTSDRAPRVSMPITFGRSRNNSEPAIDELVAFDRLRSFWCVYSALNTFRREHPLTSQFITSIDVVGNEMWTSNWPFAVLFDDARSRPALRVMNRTVHAGECFRWRMQGLRSIGELLLPNPVVERIGHALALDRAVMSSVVGTVHYRSIVEDLCWLHAINVERQQVERFLQEIVDVTRMSTYGIGIAELLHGWRLRRTAAGLREGRLIGPDLMSEADWPLETLAASEFQLSSPQRRALISLIYRGSGPLNLLDLDAGDFGLKYVEWSDRICGKVAKRLLRVIVSSGVIVESCPTSNVVLSRLTGMVDHPIGRFVDEGVAVSLNSDDPLMFGTNVVREAKQIRRYFGDSLLSRVAKTSVASCCPSVPPLDSAMCSRVAQAVAQELPA